MKNWKTTLLGIITIATAILTPIAAYLSGNTELSVAVGAIVAVLSQGTSSILSKDASNAESK